MKHPQTIITLTILITFTITTVFNNFIYAKSAETQTESKSYCVVESVTGNILYESEKDKIQQLGSISKLMIVYMIAIEIEKGNLSLDNCLIAGKNVENVTGSVIWLENGDSLSVKELLQSVIIGNANDACVTLSDYFSCDKDEVILKMNETAQKLSMKNTVFESITGTDEKKGRTTAYDVSILASKLLEYDYMHEFFSTWRTFIKNDSVELVSENKSLNTYDGTIGMKAGRIDDNNYYLIQTVKKENMVCTAVVLGCTDEDERFSFAKQLLKDSFSNYYVKMPDFAQEYVMPLDVKGGKERAVELVIESIMPLSVQKGSKEITYTIYLPDYISAPVRRGQKLGTISFFSEDKLLYTTNMCALKSVEKRDFVSSFEKIFVKLLK
jgi:D-alanyl-D-alanine carboxypeptidase (penicillin-binding protein 5/6)